MTIPDPPVHTAEMQINNDVTSSNFLDGSHHTSECSKKKEVRSLKELLFVAWVCYLQVTDCRSHEEEEKEEEELLKTIWTGCDEAKFAVLSDTFLSFSAALMTFSRL